LGAERTFEEDLLNDREIIEHTDRIVDILVDRMNRSNATGKTVTLKLKYNDFEVINRSKTFGHFISESSEIRKISNELIQKELPAKKGIRLIGVTISNLESDLEHSAKQLTLDF
jgi:DNA polymerase-4